MNTTTNNNSINNMIMYNIYFPDGDQIKTPYVSQREIKRDISKRRNINPAQIAFYADGNEDEVECGQEKEYINEGVITLFCLIKNIIKFGDIAPELFEFSIFKTEEGERVNVLDTLTLTDMDNVNDRFDATIVIEKGDATTECGINEQIRFNDERCCEFVAVIVAEETDSDEYDITELEIYADGTIAIIDNHKGDQFEADQADVFL